MFTLNPTRFSVNTATLTTVAMWNLP